MANEESGARRRVREAFETITGEVDALESNLARHREALSTIVVNANRVTAESDPAQMRWIIGCFSEIAGVVATGGTVADAIKTYEAREGRYPSK